MPAGAGCCSNGYTTRKYDLDGNTIWKSNYYQRVPVTVKGTIDDVLYVSTAALPSNTYSNGTAGVGATLTATANGTLTVGGHSVNNGDAVLIKDEAAAENNGVYLVTSKGSGATKYLLTRRTDFDEDTEIKYGKKVYASVSDQTWVLTTVDPITVGTDGLTWLRLTGSKYGTVNAQAVDDSRVYVGGSRVVKSDSHAWSLVCFDIETGETLWDYDLGKTCWKIEIDLSGHIVCMLETAAGTAAYSGTTLYDQHFIRLNTDGTLIDDIYFTQVNSTVVGGSNPVNTVDFVINEDGDYHVLGIVDSTKFLAVYEWADPFSSAPTLREMADVKTVPNSIHRFGGADYFPGRSQNSVIANQWVNLARQQVDAAAPTSVSDFDLLIPQWLKDITGLPLATISPTGTTQAGAALLTVGNDYALCGTLTACNYATDGVLPANTYSNGASGVGATLTATGNGVLSIDGTAMTNGMVVLVKDEAVAANNGVYSVTTPGTSVTPYILTRNSNFDQSAEMVYGAATRITSGTTNANSVWVMTETGPITVGTDAINWIGGTVTTGGVRLPSGSVGDIITFTNTSKLLSGFSPTITVYPPSGGKIGVNAIDAGQSVLRGQMFVCCGGNNWMALTPDYQNGFYTNCGVDADGNIIATGQATAQTCWIKINPDGVILWKTTERTLQVVVDADGNSYTFMTRDASGLTVRARDPDGAWLWGHSHAGCLTATGTRSYTLSAIDMDPDGLHVICSGGGGNTVAGGPAVKANDIDFVDESLS